MSVANKNNKIKQQHRFFGIRYMVVECMHSLFDKKNTEKKNAIKGLHSFVWNTLCFV